jgi:hypothetical protein
MDYNQLLTDFANNNWTLTESKGLQPAFDGFCQQQLDFD